MQNLVSEYKVSLEIKVCALRFGIFWGGLGQVWASKNALNRIFRWKKSKHKLFFVGRINNQTINVGRDVILGCQVQNLVSDYKVSLETKVRALLFF